jgi:Tol biopolymer transport system component
MEAGIRTTRNWAAVAIAMASIASAAALAQATIRVSVRTGGAQADDSSAFASLSADGRLVAFQSLATNLIPQGDHFGHEDIFVHNCVTGSTRCISMTRWGTPGLGESTRPMLSADGHFVVFQSEAALDPADTNAISDIYLADLVHGALTRVSLSSTQEQADGMCSLASISRDGRYVVFVSGASNLVPGLVYPQFHVYVRDLQLATTELVSVDSNGVPGNADSWAPTISDDGRFIAFYGYSSNLVPGDTNGNSDVFVRDRATASTFRVSVDSNGAEAAGYSGAPRMTPDGRFVVFMSDAPNLVPGGTAGAFDIYLRDVRFGTTEVVSVASGGARGDGSSMMPSISPDGRFIAFNSQADNLVANDTNGWEDVFLRDRLAGTTERVDVTSLGGQVTGNVAGVWPALSDDGRYVAFSTYAPDLVPMDTNGSSDVFVRDRDALGFESVCDPGTAGVPACPCANPPSGLGRGCDNSAATGGASISASGIAYVSIDSLVFTTSGELPTASSILVQGNVQIAGVVFGQGVRCAGGSLERLYTKTAVAGSITAPEPGDATVSARSAQLGDVISAGQSRWYLVYYRDPNVLGGCPAASTFNATQTARIAWSL